MTINWWKFSPAGKADVAFQAQVFTGSTNSWRDVEWHSSGEGYRCYVYYKYKSITPNEKLYSLVGDYKSVHSILSFNMSDEVFKVIIPLPSENEIKIRLLIWTNSPAFLACAGFSCYEFWVMSEESNNKIEGTQMQWTKQFVIKRSSLPRYLIFGIYWNKIIRKTVKNCCCMTLWARRRELLQSMENIACLLKQ